MKFEHKSKKWTMELGTLTQEKAENVAEAITAERKTGLHGNRNVVMSAVEADWLVDPKLTEDEIKQGDPAHISWLATKLQEQWVELVTIPKE